MINKISKNTQSEETPPNKNLEKSNSGDIEINKLKKRNSIFTDQSLELTTLSRRSSRISPVKIIREDINLNPSVDSAKNIFEDKSKLNILNYSII